MHVKLVAHSSLEQYFSSKEMLLDITKYSDVISYLTIMQPSFMYYTKKVLSEGLQETFVILDKNLKEVNKQELYMRSAKKGDTLYIVPAIIGGGGKRGGIFALLASAALFFFAGPIGGFLTETFGITAATASSIVNSTALSLAISGLTALFIKMPTAGDSSESDRVENKMFASLTNTVDNGTFLALHYGQVRVAGQLVTGYIKTLNHDKGANINVLEELGTTNTDSFRNIPGALVPVIKEDPWSTARLLNAYANSISLEPAPGRVFTDAAATLAATYGDPVGGLRDSTGALVASQSTLAHRPIFGRHPAAGIRNELTNTLNEGASVGVVGSGGSLPSSWFTTSMPAGTVEVLSTAPKNGRPNIRIRLNGTPTGTVGIFFIGSTAIEAATGQTWSASAWAQKVGGDTTNISSIRIQVDERNVSGTFISATSDNFISTADSDVRREVSRTLIDATAARVSSAVQLVTSGAIDITLDISAPQLEQSSQATAVQLVGNNRFNITEIGQSDVYYLAADGIDDWMQLTNTFAPASSYSIAAIHDMYPAPNSIFDGTKGIILGRITGESSAFYKGGRTRINLDRISGTNRLSIETVSVEGRSLDVVRIVDGSTRTAFRNGAAALSYPADDGTVIGIQLDTLFRKASAYGVGRFYGAVLIPAVITDEELAFLQDYFAALGGITL